MDKITRKSAYGFKLISTGMDWNKCDNKFLVSDTFKNLRVGQEVSKVIVNKKGFVTNVILKHESSGIEGAVPSSIVPQKTIPSSKCVAPSPDLKLRCIEIVFDSFFLKGTGMIEHKEYRDSALKLSRKLYEELQEANLEDW